MLKGIFSTLFGRRGYGWVVIAVVIAYLAGGYFALLQQPEFSGAPTPTPDTSVTSWLKADSAGCSRLNDVMYALIPAWFTEDALVSYNNDTRKLALVTNADWFRIIASGQYEGKLLVNQKRYPAWEGDPKQYPGATHRYYIVDAVGKELADLGEAMPDLVLQEPGCR